MTFSFYLDAWVYAREHNLNQIPVRVSWKEWKLSPIFEEI